MRKKVKKRKLSLKRDQRKALLVSLVSSLILKERIKTSEAKAKEIRSFAEKSLTRAKKGDLASRRLLAKSFGAKIVKKLMDTAVNYAERKGGYTRIIKLGPRSSDGAKMAIIELVK